MSAAHVYIDLTREIPGGTPKPLRLRKVKDVPGSPTRLEYGLKYGVSPGGKIRIQAIYQGPFIMELRQAATGERYSQNLDKSIELLTS